MFSPNSKSLTRCIEELRAFQSSSGLDAKRIVTSRDSIVQRAAYDQLLVTNVPGGFTKTILPVFFDGPSTLYLSSGAPNSKVEAHSHDEGDGIRVMIAGSIRYGKEELRQGDWMFVPAGQKYEFSVGPQGATMFYCYACCCA